MPSDPGRFRLTIRMFPPCWPCTRPIRRDAAWWWAWGEFPDDSTDSELAQRGYVVLAPPYPAPGGHAPDLKGLGYASGTA